MRGSTQDQMMVENALGREAPRRKILMKVENTAATTVNKDIKREMTGETEADEK